MAGKYRAGRNTAILDLKILRLIMNEAVERQLAVGNPCVQLHLERAPAKIKPEFTPEQLATIRTHISRTKDPDRHEFFSNSFEIARYQGCRLSETYLNPMTDVDLGRQTITFRTKGNRIHTTRLHPALVPLFTQLQQANRTETYRRPPGARRQWASGLWFRLFRRAKLIGLCFHSLRVTAATAMARNHVPENLAKEFIGHASTTVHRGYLRLKSSDLGACTDAIT